MGDADPGADRTAQQAFEHLIRDLIAPALRELGFAGRGPRTFRLRRGEYQAVLWTRKSMASTRRQVRFWVHLSAVHVPTKAAYWTSELPFLVPGHDTSGVLTISAGQPAEPVAGHLMDMFRAWGWPALQAAVDAPGYPPDPSAAWAQTFHPVPSWDRSDRGTASPGPITWPAARTGRPADELFADLADRDWDARLQAAFDIGNQALGDPRAVPALMNRLEHDPSPLVRTRAAMALRPVASQEQVRQAFQAAARHDEDRDVRWAARYGLRLGAEPAADAS